MQTPTPTPTQSPNHLTLLQTYTNTLQNQNNAKLEQIRLLHQELSNSRQLYNSRVFVTTTMAPVTLCSGCEKMKQDLEKVREELEIVSRERLREKEEQERGRRDGDRGRREFQMVKRELDNANKDYDRVSLANVKLNQDLAELRAEVRRLEGIKRDQKERIVEKVVVKEVESTEIRAAYQKLQLINEQLNKKYETSKQQYRNLQQIHEKSVPNKSQQQQIQIQTLHKYNRELIQKIQVLQQKLFLSSQTCSIPKIQILDQEKQKSRSKSNEKQKIQILSPFQYQFMTQRSSVSPGIRINVQPPSAQNNGVEVPVVKVVQNGGVHRHGRSVLVEQAPVKIVYPTFRHLSPAPICSHLSPLSVLTHNHIPAKHDSHLHKDASYINNYMNYYKDLKQQRWRSLQHKIHFLEQQNRQLRSNVITSAYI